MLKHKFLPVVALLVLGAIHTEAFSLSRPSLVGHSTSWTPSVRSFTCLHAEESQESQEEGEASDNDDAPPAPDGGAGDDILNSPAFLKRKIDVLKSDLEAADAEIATLTAAVEEGKAEWGDQLEKLQTEVCFVPKTV